MPFVSFDHESVYAAGLSRLHARLAFCACDTLAGHRTSEAFLPGPCRRRRQRAEDLGGPPPLGPTWAVLALGLFDWIGPLLWVATRTKAGKGKLMANDYEKNSITFAQAPIRDGHRA